ncbi:MAG TPA: SgcJ/EcaC family oxidoreductase [Bryobacteraceae bacterium]|nr:SgcJ/EcaC family oxidoreductase [Bryobacteraceae bacterium]HPT27534.1 SgcJ/EcaC family oxidoreductase [Bryobacteraceae bacterium]
MPSLIVPILLLLAATQPQDEIRAVLATQEQAWNRADIETFMTGYLESEEITFQGRTGVTRGYAAVKERYKRAYPTPGKMGELKFTIDEVRLVAADAALVLGGFALTRTTEAGGDASGRFSLVLVKTPKGWKIVHDHTS